MLEDRTLPSVTYFDNPGNIGKKIVQFTEDALGSSDTLLLRPTNGGQLEYSFNGSAFSTDLNSSLPGVQALSLTSISRIDALLAGGNDVLDVDGLLDQGIIPLPSGIVFAAGASVLPRLFTDDPSVLAAVGVPWWFLVAQLPLAGIVFALDGVLLGAGDAAFMRTATVISALVGFLPPVWLSLAFDWGLAGIWSGLSMFIALRLIFVGWRALSGDWAVTGT